MRISNQQKSACCILMVAEIIVWCSAAVGADHTITYPELVPEIMWCRGCAPTSAAMAIGYWDNHVGSLTSGGFGRLIDYWQDLSKYSDGTGPLINVPNILDELRLAMGTTVDGGTNTDDIGPGIISVANTTNGYSFSSNQCSGSSLNDYCWGTITDEINAKRPFVWSVGLSGQVGHSLCAWGYTDSKYVIVYNTWNYGRDDWYYTKYDNGPNTDWQYVDTVVQSGGQGFNTIFLQHPSGGQVLNVGETFTIWWFHSGILIDNVDLYYSINGGATWTVIDTGLYSIAGSFNSYPWTVPNAVSNRVRVKAYGYDNETYIAGDGSTSNLTIQCPSLSPPPDVSATDTVCDRVQVSWGSVSGATTYEIWRNTTNNSGSASYLGDDSSSPYDDYGATAGVTYYYWVKAKNACGSSDFSSPDPGYRATVPPVPTGVSASDGTYCNMVRVSWNASSGATSYEMWRNTTNNSSTASHIADDDSSPYDDYSVTPGVTYYYWVKAKNVCGTSGFSSSDSGYSCIIRPCLVYVDDDYSPITPGWGIDHFNNIQNSIHIVCEGGTIIVAEGNYFENINFNGKNIILTSTDPNNPNIVAETIINGSQAADPNYGATVTFVGIEDPNCILTGFTITGGTGNYLEGWTGFWSYWGGGICVEPNASPTITKNVITGNTAGYGGANIWCGQNSQARIIANTVENGNSLHGSGIYCENAYGTATTGPFIAYNIIRNNRSDSGAAITCGNSANATIINNIIVDNQASIRGGAIHLFMNSTTIVNNTIAYNAAPESSAIDCRSTATFAVISSNIISFNKGGSALYVYVGEPNLNLIYNDFWANEGGDFGATIDSNNPGWVGNIYADPLFVDAYNGDYHLLSQGWRWNGQEWIYDRVTSRCIDAGNPGSSLGDEPLTIPIDPNNKWGQNFRIDMGAYGSTAEASMPPYDWAILADLTNDGVVDFTDLVYFAQNWLTKTTECPADLDRNAFVRYEDLALFADDWLKETIWH